MLAIVSESWFYILSHLFFSLLLVHVAWWLLGRVQFGWAYNPVAATVLAAAMSFYTTGDQMVKTMHAQRIVANRQAASAQAAQAVQNIQTNIQNMRTEFLRTVDNATEDPAQVTAESKAALFDQYKILFPNGIADVRQYHNELKVAYECQLSLAEDNLNTKKKNKAVKSDKTKGCEALPGGFFNRQKLLPPEAVVLQDTIKKAIVEGKPEAPSEKDLQGQVTRQQTKMKLLNTLFQ
jgi:hypothetical protein